ncbi:MAG: ABC transporter ATP-binding protein, partial [Ktedonobacterales bacterium]
MTDVASAENAPDARPGDTALRTGEIILRTQQLTKRYGARLAVDALDLEVRRGDIFGFLGPNGAG